MPNPKHRRHRAMQHDHSHYASFTPPSFGNLKPRLTEHKGRLILQFGDKSIQSEMNIDDPDQIIVAYARSMMSFLLFNPNPKHIGMIGLGGGSLAKYCYRYLPETQITIAEISPEVIALRDEFAIPADNHRFSIVQQDGALLVATPKLQFDVLLVDGFDHNGLPNALCSQEFYHYCRKRLGENGLLVANLWTNNKFYPTCLTRIRCSFNDQILIATTHDPHNNIVLAGKKLFACDPQTLTQRAQQLNKEHHIDFIKKLNSLQSVT